jgi:hypothetical protein
MTSTLPTTGTTGSTDRELVEMAWDPITRIVGSLGIYNTMPLITMFRWVSSAPFGCPVVPDV